MPPSLHSMCGQRTPSLSRGGEREERGGGRREGGIPFGNLSRKRIWKRTRMDYTLGSREFRGNDVMEREGETVGGKERGIR